MKSFNNGDFDTTAIVRVFNALPPQAATLKNIAAIISAIYADTYWSRTFMDSTILSKALVKALGVNQPDADAAAQFAFSSWRGMLVRGSTSDTGSPMPRGVLTQSIDDIVNGKDPIDPTILFNRWTSPFFNQADGLKNFCYTRAQSVNFLEPITKATVRMFFTDQGFNLPPQSWLEMPAATGGALSAPMMNESLDPKQPIAPTGRSVSSDAFFFTPAGGGHYCLLAVVATEFFTNDPLSGGTGNFNAMQWISSNGAAGWHNINVITKSVANFKLYNQDPRTERFVVHADCLHLPPGTRVSLEAAGTTLGIDPQEITRPYQTVSAEGDLPPGYAGDVVLRIDTPGGQSLPENAAIDVHAHWIVPFGHRDYARSVAHIGALAAAREQQPVELEAGSVRLIAK